MRGTLSTKGILKCEIHLSEKLDTFDNIYIREMCGIKPKIENIIFVVQKTMPEISLPTLLEMPYKTYL